MKQDIKVRNNQDGWIQTKEKKKNKEEKETRV